MSLVLINLVIALACGTVDLRNVHGGLTNNVSAVFSFIHVVI